jgi:hypothetical protein
MNFRKFFSELRRRNVYKVAVAYAIVGWLIVQIATQVFPFLEIPNWLVEHLSRWKNCELKVAASRLPGSSLTS